MSSGAGSPGGDLLVRGIGELTTNDPDAPEGAPPAAILIRRGRIEWVGPDAAVPAGPDVAELDAGGRAVVPGFVDAHTHLVFAGDRAAEFALRLEGASYEEVLDAGGGIHATVRATRAATLPELVDGAVRRAGRALATGTTTIEIKSGYGLDLATEVRLLETIRAVAERLPLDVVPTFLGAHVVPEEYRDDRAAYVRVVIDEMLPECAPLARFCDVFCDRGAFTVAEAEQILGAAARHGLELRLHAEQLAATGAAALAAQLGAASADHLDHAADADLAALRAAGTVAVLLPGVSFSMRTPFPDARRFWRSGVAVAIATDCNPGTAYVETMPFMIALACAELGLTPAQAVWAASRGGALALRRPDLGWIRPGAAGDLVVLDAPSPVHLAYRPDAELVHAVVKAGVAVPLPDSAR